MPKSKLRAIAPDGTVFTRTTARTYTHVVIGRVSEAQQRHHIASSGNTKADRVYYEHQVRDAERTDAEIAAMGMSWKFTERERAIEWLATLAKKGVKTADAYVAKCIADRQALFDHRLAGTFFTVWHDMGWCGRHDLALKAQAHNQGRAYYTDIRIIPVEPHS